MTQVRIDLVSYVDTAIDYVVCSACGAKHPYDADADAPQWKRWADDHKRKHNPKEHERKL